MVVDDYAHHPTDDEGSVVAARATGRRVVAAFQPHRYTRTQKLMAEFADSFGDADVVALTDIYAAGEAPIPGVDAAALATGIRQAKGTGVIVVPSLAELARELAARTRPGDLVLTMGAGNVRDAARDAAGAFARRGAPAAAGVGWPASGGKVDASMTRGGFSLGNAVVSPRHNVSPWGPADTARLAARLDRSDLEVRKTSL